MTSLHLLMGLTDASKKKINLLTRQLKAERNVKGFFPLSCLVIYESMHVYLKYDIPGKALVI